MLLGIFLYNGTMFYELKNGTLVETKDAQGNFDLTQVLGNKYLEDVDSEKCVIVDTYSNRCFLISKDLLHHGVSEEVYHKMLDSDETDSNKSSEEVTFILTITYKCNMHCTYCYQQNDKTLVNCRWSFSDLKPECRSCRNVLRCMNMQCKKSEIIDGKTVCLYRKSECV